MRLYLLDTGALVHGAKKLPCHQSFHHGELFKFKQLRMFRFSNCKDSMVRAPLMKVLAREAHWSTED